MSRLAVILPAAGLSLRFGRPKLLENIAGQTVLARSAAAFLQRSDVIQLVISTQSSETVQSLLPSDSRIRFAAGGSSRAHSVRSALALIDPSIELVAVHDAARPLISQTLIDSVLSAAIRNGAAGPALPVHLHIRRGEGALPTQAIATVPRQNLFAMQTPQIARAELLREAFAAAGDRLDEVTDDLQLLEAIGVRPTLVAGEERNLKITTQIDLHLATILINSTESISLG